eukprot:298708_1
MAEEDIHRQSVSRSIQYSDYSSGDDYQPQPSDIQSTQHNETEEDDDSSSSSSYAPVQPKQIEKKRTSATIQSKLNTITKQFTPNESKDNNINNNEITPQSEKKAKLTAKWKRQLAANSSDNKKLHESQKVIKPKNINSIHDGIGTYGINQYTDYKRKKSHTAPPQKVVISPTSKKKNNKNINNNNPYDGLTPIEIWKKKKAEKEKNNDSHNIENEEQQEFEHFAAELKRQKMEEMKENNNEIDTIQSENVDNEIVNNEIVNESVENENNEKEYDETMKTDEIEIDNVDVEVENETVELNDESQM